MKTVKVYGLLLKRVLVTPGSARAIEPELRAALREGGGAVELDFTGVEGLTPSFLDETLGILSAALADEHYDKNLSIVLNNPPTRLSSKFTAVGRSHNLSVALDEHGRWVIAKDIAAEKDGG